jgi:glycosyltransferase involved in cell wall biosynthesis
VKKFKVLVSAYACEPDKGSEPGVGWNWVKQISRFAEVWVITRANNREVIEKALLKEPMPNVHWVYFDLPRWTKFWKKGKRGVRVYYYLWQIGIYFIGKRLNQKIKFDIIHHVTFVTYWLPSFLSLISVPFIWGPVGGGETYPQEFNRTFSLRGKIYESFRNIVRWLSEHDPLVRITTRKSSIAIGTTTETLKRLEKIGSKNVMMISQVALRCDEIKHLYTVSLRNSNPIRFFSVGSLLHWKGYHMGMCSFSQLLNNFKKCEYWLIGDGPEKKRLKSLAFNLGISDKVKFHGSVNRSEVFNLLNDCDILLHPSFHDSGGYVCAEAMAAGKPVVCLDLGGPALQVTEETGFKILARTPEQVIEDMANAMRKLAEDPELRKRMGEAGRKRVLEHFTWEKKGEFIKELYEEVYEYSMRS